jgi:hypothetical protein
MNITALLAVTLSALEVLSPVAGSIPAAPMPVTPITEAGDSTQVAVRGQWAPVRSPWGYCARYFVHPGWNRLVCSGTGLCFDHFHYGCSVEAEQGPVAE